MWDLVDAQRDLRPKSQPLVRNDVDPGTTVRVLTSVGPSITLCWQRNTRPKGRRIQVGLPLFKLTIRQVMLVIDTFFTPL
jgi:hypothetical protein